MERARLSDPDGAGLHGAMLRNDAAAQARLRDVVLAAFGGALLAAVPLLYDSRAYYRDDMQSQYMPTFYAIGHTLLTTGTVPNITTLDWYGGNLAGEYQYGLFNPVCLSLFRLLPAFSTLQAGAAFLAVVYTAILAAGAFLLATNLGSTRALAHVAAIVLSTNQFVFYWYSSVWFPGLVSTAFMTVAMALLLRARASPGAFAGAGLFVALTVSAGWPHSVILLALFVVILAGVEIARRDYRAAAAPAAAALLGALASSVALAPLIAAKSVAVRPYGVFNDGFLTPGLGDLLSVADPLHFGRISAFFGYKSYTTPFYYAAWFLPSLACVLDFRAVDWRARGLRVASGFAVLTAFLCRGPEQIGPVRWPIRFLPAFQMSLVLAFIVAMAQAGLAPLTRRRAIVLGIVQAPMVATAWQVNPLSFSDTSGIVGIVVVSSTLFAVMPAAHRLLFIGAISAALACVVRVLHPSNTLVADWNFVRRPEHVMSLSTVPRSYELHVSGAGVPTDAGRFDDFLFGQMGLSLGRSTINGYSPLGQRAFAERFCMQTHGWTCLDGGVRALAVEPETGRPFLELMRVDELFVERGPRLRAIRQRIGPTWRSVEERERAVVFRRELPNARLPGSVAWPTTGMVLEPSGEARAEREALRVVRRDSGTNRIVFARMFWPGYRATFAGASVPVRALAGFLVSVDLPPAPGAGELVLSFETEGRLLALMASGVGVIGLVATLIFRLLRRRLPA